LLETLAKYAHDDGQFVFQMPLARPTDIKFWSREFHLSAEEVEHTFDIFEQSALIQPWREPKTICAPMLGARVDEWTKRKNKARSPKKHKALGNGHQQENEQENEDEHQQQHQHNITPEKLGSCSGVPKPAVAVVDGRPSSQTHTQDKEAGSGQTRLTDGEIVAEYLKTANTLGVPFDTTEPHRKAGIAFFKKYGRDVAMAAWFCFLRNSPKQVQIAGRKEYRAWRLKDFLDSGEAEVYADDVRPIVERGVTPGEAVSLLRGEDFPANFDRLLQDNPDLAHRVLRFLNQCESADRADDAYLNSDSSTLFDYVVKAVQNAKSAQVQ